MSELKDFAGVIGAAVGAMLGGSIAIFVTSLQLRHQRGLEVEKRLLSHYAEIHEIVSEYESAYVVFAMLVADRLRTGQKIEKELLPTSC